LRRIPVVTPRMIWVKVMRVIRWRDWLRKRSGRRDFMSVRAKIE
jgi:hypothetical protein